ncbi:MAG: hypothetical protein Kow0068_00800 [Marinilabiliales bacterium]
MGNVCYSYFVYITNASEIINLKIMKNINFYNSVKIFVVLLMLSITINSFSQVQSDCNIPTELFSNYDFDVKNIAVRRIFEIGSSDTSEIDIPQAYMDTIWLGLAGIFNAMTIPERDSVFDIYCIHDVSPQHRYVYYSILVKVDLSYGWPYNWQNMNTTTGYYQLDNFLYNYGFHITNYINSIDVAVLETNQELNTRALCDSLEKFDGVIYAEQDFIAGDGNIINFSSVNDTLYYDFVIKWGDCYAGCFNYLKYKFKVNVNNCIVWYCGVDSIINYYSEPLPAPVNCMITNNIGSQPEIQDIKIYPNPFTDIINITGLDRGFIQILSSEGKLIEEININSNPTTVDLKRLPNGMYIIKYIGDNRVKQYKILKTEVL